MGVCAHEVLIGLDEAQPSAQGCVVNGPNLDLLVS